MAAGRVVTQAASTCRITRQWASPLTAPIPKSAPHATWVVDTGRPRGEAAVTSAAVTRLTAKPWPWFRTVMPCARVWATRRAARRPPADAEAVLVRHAQREPGVAEGSVESRGEPRAQQGACE